MIVNYCHEGDGGSTYPDDFQEGLLLDFYYLNKGHAKPLVLHTSTNVTLYMALCLIAEGKIPREEVQLQANGHPIEVNENLQWVWPRESGMPDPMDFHLRCMRASVVQYYNKDRREE